MEKRTLNERQNMFKEIRIAWNFLTGEKKVPQTRRQCSGMIKIWKENKNCEPIFFYPVKISFQSKDKKKYISDDKKLKEFITQRLRLQVIWKENPFK